MYHKFLRGVSIASESDSDYEPLPEGEDDGSDEDDGNNTEPEAETSLALYEPDDNSSGPIMLSHLLDSNAAGPMTRRRFQRTSLSNVTFSPTWARPAQKREEEKQMCIVCYVEPRAVVCWPCRCLCICDDCRSSLASLPLNQHLCPTCRTP